MHDKTFVVDGQIAITGGRNMADEYFDFDHEYNFRDREVLVLGEVVPAISASFEHFWTNDLVVPVEKLFDGFGLLQAHVSVDTDQVQQVYRQLRAYAASPANFAPEIRAVLADIPAGFPQLASKLSWGGAKFLSDRPGKSARRAGLAGGGLTTAALAALVESARSDVLIQSPYLVMSDAALELFRRVLARGVRVRISTNSLASTDNLQAYSGYRNQRAELLAMGLEIHEYRPDPAIRTTVMQRYAALREQAPVFALHAKTMVIDGQTLYVGTFNLDPRSENLNTEVGIVIHDPGQARAVVTSIETDMLPANSWNASASPDQFAPWDKRVRVAFWQWLPIKPLL
jgi:putative cardiolipin synthase